MDPESSRVLRVIPLQYNPETLNRSFEIKGSGGEGGDRSEALRLKGPAVESIKLEAEIDATDLMEVADSTTADLGIHPQLAALETMVYPTGDQLQENNRLAKSGTLEITPIEAPLTFFVWSKQRVLPVRVTELNVTEEAFDPDLNPIRAKVSLGLRVLSIDDLGFEHKGGSVFMSYLRQKEELSKKVQGKMSALGIERIP